MINTLNTKKKIELNKIELFIEKNFQISFIKLIDIV